MSLQSLIAPTAEEQIKIIKSELNEDADRFNNNIKLFEEWIKFQPHIPKNYERNMLQVFLRGCKHDLEKSKRKFEMYLVCRSTLPELFKWKFDKNEQKALSTIYVNALTKTDPKGYRVSYVGLHNSDLDSFDISICIRYIWKCGHVRVCKESVIAGDIFVVDASNFTAAHAAKILCPLVKQSMYATQEAFINRIKKIYIINTHPLVEKTLNFLKMFFKEKIRERISMERGSDLLMKEMPQYCLPKDYGGAASSNKELDTFWKTTLEQNDAWFMEQAEIKAVGDIPTNLQKFSFDSYNFGMEGSFRKLNID